MVAGAGALTGENTDHWAANPEDALAGDHAGERAEVGRHKLRPCPIDCNGTDTCSGGAAAHSWPLHGIYAVNILTIWSLSALALSDTVSTSTST
ncbi:jg21420 [Pararge aegeria aegeria]|uniref:Jg21420 protein n=1 Tax=Pararge aegeria aegeria TaxID=348720 RepID=A0A8S4R415_9NEOP|nr:jg21420 [Pararge aegeria aegeria]